MTPQEAIQFTKGADAACPPTVWDQLRATEVALHALEATASPTALRKARQSLLDSAEAYRRADTPGHTNWYEHHLRPAALASERWAKKIGKGR